jgi:hypothetical protein
MDAIRGELQDGQVAFNETKLINTKVPIDIGEIFRKIRSIL